MQALKKMALRDISTDISVQRGANVPMELAFQEGWFTGYDWVIRINPDVLIRNSTWLLDAMMQTTETEDKTTNSLQRQRSIDGIFVECCQPSKLHTDFFAFRPNFDSVRRTTNATTANRNLPFSELVNGNHELTATAYFQPILDSGRYALLPDAATSYRWCRVRGERSSVIHDHTSCRLPPSTTPLTGGDNGYGDLVCNALKGWDIT
mmetsp:Transcript_21174/g.20339  ORF Transcript_21174/g.20339 Transcript_21174/m.20339 type:complete len:207 (+) Transcript_21174:2-622(+)